MPVSGEGPGPAQCSRGDTRTVAFYFRGLFAKERLQLFLNRRERHVGWRELDTTRCLLVAVRDDVGPAVEELLDSHRGQEKLI